MNVKMLSIALGLFTAFGCSDDSVNNVTPETLNNSNNKFEKVNFKSEGDNIVGNLYYPANYVIGQKYPAIIVSGSWTTVKEQMAGTYAQRFADQGFITIAIDFRGFGESEGIPRFWENPNRKIQDIKNVVTYLETLPEVNNDKIGAFAVCASSMYTLFAASEDSRIKALVTAATWVHNKETVAPFYGGIEEADKLIAASKAAEEDFNETGNIQYVKTIDLTDPNAAMTGNYDYYLNPDRGAIPEWSADKFAVMSWEGWLTIDALTELPNQVKQPILMIHSEGAVLPNNVKSFYENLGTPNDQKNIIWITPPVGLEQSPYHQFSFYDQDPEIDVVIENGTVWFNNKL